MGALDAMDRRIIADANTIPPEVTEALPRLDLKLRYGTTFIVLTMERMVVQRGVVPMHLAEVLGRHDGVLVYKDRYVDCPHCRRQRLGIVERHEGYSRERLIELLGRWREDDTYWCNSCQGIGWHLEPWEDVIARLDILTWDEKARRLTNPELRAAIEGHDRIRWRTLGEGWPIEILTAEAARRLEAA